MDAELMSWKNDMLAAINRQTTHSLRVIKSIFKRCGRSLPPNFKQYFLQISSHSIKTTYEQCEMDSLFEESTDANMDSLAVTGGSLNNRQKWFKYHGSIDQTSSFSIYGSDDDDFVMETLGAESIDDANEVGNGVPSNVNLNEIGNGTILTETTSDAFNSNNESIAIYELHGTNNGHESNANEEQNIKQGASIDLNCAVKLHESNESIDLIENLNDSINSDDNEFIPVNIVLNRLDETTSAGLVVDKIKTTSLNRKYPIQKRMMKMQETNDDRDYLATEGGKSLPKQLAPGNPNRCNVCGYVSSHMGNFNRHMRTHTGEKRCRCDRCGRAFTNTANLLKHAATHVEEFPFHCKACFHGFSLKAEAVAHEKRCKKRRFECHICKKSVTCHKTDLIRHMRKHTGFKPFRCEICMQRFSLEHNLKQHLNKIHAKFNERK